jgi:hypothetical protein
MNATIATFLVGALLVFTVPVIVMAKVLDADRSSALYCAAVGIAGMLVFSYAAKAAPHFGMIVGPLAAGVFYKFTLGTTYPRGMAVSFTQIAVYVLCIFLLLRKLVLSILDAIGMAAGAAS